MRKTKIVCTLGPATDDKETIIKLVEAGMNVARLNFSHGDHQEHGNRIDLIKEIEKEVDQPIGIMLDTQGPEIRTGKMKNDKIFIKDNQEINITTKEVLGDEHKFQIKYNNLTKDINEDSVILIDDGLIELKIEKILKDEIVCRVINGGNLGSHKGVNIPGIKTSLPAITKKDKEDILFGIKHNIHFIAASFVRKAADVIEIRKVLEEEWAQDIKIISKIESEESVGNIDEIIEVSDGIMIARGDLGVEIPAEKVPIIQKMIIKKCNEVAKPVITATQLLDSMIRNPRPTRAEASDVANAIFDGTDATMLSGETAIGNFPVNAVKTMANIANEIERSDTYKDNLSSNVTSKAETVTEAISIGSCEIASGLSANAIITATGSGSTARMVSKCRSLTPIVAVTPNDIALHNLTLSWGVYPIMADDSKSTDEMMDNSISVALKNELVNEGDLVVLTAGVPVGTPGTTNLIKVDIVGDPIVEGKGIGRKIIHGHVKKVSSAKEALEEIEEGDIIVTRTTNNQYLEAIKKSAGIIAVEGGVTSHSAVFGIQFNKPVVVGAVGVMELLEDGELITIDSVRGQIYKGKVNLK
ncbi:MAG: pyruvate kinase [Halanaerobiales bacterium]|nr:pyruvate kinase [Halanaerobiales bacterium]